ncbi:MAG TPA: hypothetical protein VED20_10440 [Streptosporangiaceae bacterium]|nr:hypothetical protein [Streptosporangiaceae bacterium]
MYDIVPRATNRLSIIRYKTRAPCVFTGVLVDDDEEQPASAATASAAAINTAGKRRRVSGSPATGASRSLSSCLSWKMSGSITIVSSGCEPSDWPDGSPCPFADRLRRLAVAD